MKLNISLHIPVYLTVSKYIPLYLQHSLTISPAPSFPNPHHLGVIWLHQSSGVHLDPFQVDAAGTNGLAHLDAIAGGVVPVGGGQVQEVRAVLGQQGILRQKSCRSAGGMEMLRKNGSEHG